MAFDAVLEEQQDEVRITLTGELDGAVAPQFKEVVEKGALSKPKRLVLFMKDLEFLASAGLRVLIFARQKMGSDVAIYVVGSRGAVLNTLEMSGFHHSVFLQDEYSPS